jgi:selenocysteine-specific elongation factor
VAARGDRVVLRDKTTLGGGRVLDPAPPRAPDLARLELLSTDDPASIVRALVHEPVRANDLAARALLSPTQLAEGLTAVEQTDGWHFSAEWLDQAGREARTRLTLRAEAAPLDPGLSAGDLLAGAPWADAILPLLELEQRNGKVYLPGAAASLGEKAADAEALEARLEEAGLEPTRVDDPELVRFLEAEGRLVRVGDGLAVGIRPYEAARRALIEECESAGKITLARFRDLMGISRRPAQLLLERFDADGLTRRVGDERVLRRAVRR